MVTPTRFLWTKYLLLTWNLLPIEMHSFQAVSVHWHKKLSKQNVTERNGQVFFWGVLVFPAASCFVLRLQVVSDFAFCCGHSLITKKCCILIYFQWFIKKEMCLLFTMLMIKSIWISTFKQRPFCLRSPGTSTLLSVKLRDTQDLPTAHISLSATKIMAI